MRRDFKKLSCWQKAAWVGAHRAIPLLPAKIMALKNLHLLLSPLLQHHITYQPATAGTPDCLQEWTFLTTSHHDSPVSQTRCHCSGIPALPRRSTAEELSTTPSPAAGLLDILASKRELITVSYERDTGEISTIFRYIKQLFLRLFADRSMLPPLLHTHP